MRDFEIVEFENVYDEFKSVNGTEYKERLCEDRDIAVVNIFLDDNPDSDETEGFTLKIKFWVEYDEYSRANKWSISDFDVTNFKELENYARRYNMNSNGMKEIVNDFANKFITENEQELIEIYRGRK